MWLTNRSTDTRTHEHRPQHRGSPPLAAPAGESSEAQGEVPCDAEMGRRRWELRRAADVRSDSFGIRASQESGRAVYRLKRR